MNYAVMPLSDYDAACDKVREKVDLTAVRFEETNFGYLRSAAFAVKESGTYTFTIEVKDESELNIYEAVFGNVDWNPSTQPGQFDSYDGSTASGRFGQGVETCIYVSNSRGLKPSDITSATLSYNGEVVENFVEPQKIKSGELADKVDEVYMAGAYDFGLKGKGQGELVHFENVHPIEHKIEVGVRSKNLFKAINEDIPIVSGVKYQLTSAEDTSNTRTQFWLYDANKNELKTLTQSMYGFYYGTAYGYWLSGSDTSKLNFSLTFPSEVAYIRFRNAYVDMQFERADTPTAYAPFVADFSDCKVRTTGKNLLNLEGRTVVNFGGWGDKKRIFPEGKGIILALAGSNYYSGANATDHIYSVGNGNIFYDQKGDYYGIGLDLPLTPNTTYKFSYGAMTGGTSLMEFDTEGNYLGQQYFSPVVKTKANTAWGVLLFADMASVDISVTNPQLEVGTTATEYEPYNEASAEYTTAADGTVEGVKSISPVMNISTDKAGAVIDAEYFLDPQAVITDLTNTVITLGGEI